MTNPRISADDHIDLGYLPRNLWTERLRSLCANARRTSKTAVTRASTGLRRRYLGGLSRRALVCSGESNPAGSRSRRRRRSAPAHHAGETTHRYGP